MFKETGPWRKKGILQGTVMEEITGLVSLPTLLEPHYDTHTLLLPT